MISDLVIFLLTFDSRVESCTCQMLQGIQLRSLSCSAIGRCIAVYPVYLSRQHTRLTHTDFNQLHLFSTSDLCDPEKHKSTADGADDNRLSTQYKQLLTRDSASLFVLVFLVCTLEMRNTNSDPLNYSVFNIVFEVIRLVFPKAISMSLLLISYSQFYGGMSPEWLSVRNLAPHSRQQYP